MRPKTLVKATKVPIAKSGGTLPKSLSPRSAEFWAALNQLLQCCLADCGINMKIKLGEDEERFYAEACPLDGKLEIDEKSAE